MPIIEDQKWKCTFDLLQKTVCCLVLRILNPGFKHF